MVGLLPEVAKTGELSPLVAVIEQDAAFETFHVKVVVRPLTTTAGSIEKVPDAAAGVGVGTRYPITCACGSTHPTTSLPHAQPLTSPVMTLSVRS